MKFALRHRDELVGVFVLFGILCVAGALVFMGLNKRWLQRDPQFRSHFQTAEGLNAGMALELQGFAIGRVKQVRLGDDRLVEVVFSVHREHAELVRPGSVVELVVQPLGFGAKLVLYPGRGGGDPLPAGSAILSTDLPAGQARLARGEVERVRRRDETAALLAALPSLVGEAEALVITLNRMATRLDDQLLGGEAGPSTGLLASAGAVMTGVDQAVSGAASLMADLEPAVAELNRLLGHVANLSARLDGPEGPLAAVAGPDGSVGRLLQDEGALFGELLLSLQELKALLAFFNASAPEIAALMQQATGALAEGEKVAQGLRNNPLLRGGVSPAPATPGTFSGFRPEVR